jgi:outer membrane protein insertion porin family
LVYRFNDIGFGGGGTNNPSDDDYRERRTGGQVGFSRSLSDELSLGASIRYENIKTILNTTDPSDNFIRQDGDVAVLTFGATRNRRDNNIDPSRGDLVRLQVEPGYGNTKDVGTSTDDENVGSGLFLRNTLEYRIYWSDQPARQEDITASRRVLALRAKVGVITGKIPFFEQFFVGGADSVRGYPEDRYWGKNMALLSLEYRFPIQQSFSVVAFTDYGSAWGGYGSVGTYIQTDSPAFHFGYGLGFSFKTPLGPIRIDFGFDDRGRSRTHFQIGTSF